MNPENKDLSHIVVDNFHPQWEEASRAIGGANENARLMMLSDILKKYSLAELTLANDEYNCLTHILFEDYSGLYLDKGNKRYYSRGISAQDEGKVVLLKMAMQEHIKLVNNYLKFMTLAELAITSIRED